MSPIMVRQTIIVSLCLLFVYNLFSVFVVIINLVCSMPDDYPECVPEITIDVEKGLSRLKHEEAIALANTTAEDNMGMPSIFVIAEALRYGICGSYQSSRYDLTISVSLPL